jgi:serine/threonine-protein kinase
LLPLAKGGMAQVWAARLLGSRGFQKLVAVKTILSGSLDDTRMERMFLEEASLAALIRSPNVVETMELGEHDGTLYLVMEWVEGEPLHYIANRAGEYGGLPLEVAVNLVAQTCKGLQAAHDLTDESGVPLGLVHRDISPQNVLVSYRGSAKLVDFGIAKATARASALTELGEIKGKFGYMAPEQVRGEAIDRRTDIFAVGIVLYMLTTGHHPFKGNNPAETVKRICSRHPAPRPSQLVPGYPPALEAVVMRALSKKRDERFETAHEMVRALESAVPKALDPSFETELAAYLGSLLADRQNERRRALRAALEAADKAREDASSFSSLRAISLEPAGTLDNSSTRGAPSEATPALRVEADPLRSRFRKGAAFAGAAVLLGVVGLIAPRWADAPPVPAQAPAAAARPEAVTPAPRASLSPSVAAPAAAVPEATQVAQPRAHSRELPGRAPAKRLSVTGRVANAAEASTDAGPVKRDSDAPAERRAADAWNPETFGGRR